MTISALPARYLGTSELADVVDELAGRPRTGASSSNSAADCVTSRACTGTSTSTSG